MDEHQPEADQSPGPEILLTVASRIRDLRRFPDDAAPSERDQNRVPGKSGRDYNTVQKGRDADLVRADVPVPGVMARA